MSEKQQKLVLAIMDFLTQSIQDGTVKQDDSEGLQVAVQCIGEAFGVDPGDQDQLNRLSIQPATLPSIFDVYLKTKDRMGSSSTSSATKASTSATPLAPSAADKAAAEKHKQSGNMQMSSKQYDSAIESYTKAIALDPSNPVYYSNRAAAHSSKQDHANAVTDAEKAIEVDSAYSKAYHRLGHAHYSLGNYTAAVSAFEDGLKVDPTNANLKSGLQNSQARVVPSPTSSPPPEPAVDATAAGGLGGMADMLRGMGGGGGGGGMPDLSSFLSNPGMMQMAQQMMANGGLDRLMNNPGVANMMNRMQGGGGLPSMAEIMSDPNLRDMAGQFMGAGRGADGAPPGSA